MYKPFISGPFPLTVRRSSHRPFQRIFLRTGSRHKDDNIFRFTEDDEEEGEDEEQKSRLQHHLHHRLKFPILIEPGSEKRPLSLLVVTCLYLSASAVDGAFIYQGHSWHSVIQEIMEPWSMGLPSEVCAGFCCLNPLSYRNTILELR